MAMTPTQGSTARRLSGESGVWRIWYRLHFLIRFLGLTGLLVGVIGLVLAWREGLLATWQTCYDTSQTAVDDLLILGRLKKEFLTVYLVLGSGLAIAFALLIELLLGLGALLGRRSALGFSAVLQIVLATVLLIAVNIYSVGIDFSGLSVFGRPIEWEGKPIKLDGHHARFDWTRDHRFTLPDDVREQMEKLKGEKTTIVVYNMDKMFGAIKDKSYKSDYYDEAAEKVIAAKVKDLVEQFGVLGQRFEVVEIETKKEGDKEKLDKLTEKSPALRQAIDAAKENSIFFHAKRVVKDGPEGKEQVREFVQRLSFNEFYRFDKTASEKADGGKGNLVLLAQGEAAPGSPPSGRGIEAFARKIFNMEEKRPRVGIAVVHEYLTTRGPNEYGLAGLKESLTTNGFEVRDVILKRPGPGTWTPVVYTYDENKLARLEQQLKVVELLIVNQERAEKEIKEERTHWEKDTLEVLQQAYARELRGRKLTEKMRKEALEDIDEQLASLKDVLEKNRSTRDTLRDQRDKLDVDALLEQQRMSDLQAKMTQLLADCDLLIVPRATLSNVIDGTRNVPPWLHGMDAAQMAAIREFLKAGKPVLALFGPDNEPPDERGPPAGFTANDGLEDLLGQLGIKFGKQTVLFDAESEAFGAARSGLLSAGADVQVPPLEFNWKPGEGRPQGQLAATDTPPHPLRTAMDLETRTLGKNHALELRLRHPRPVYYKVPEDKSSIFLAQLSQAVQVNPLGLDGFATAARIALVSENPELTDLYRAYPVSKQRFEPEFLMTSKESWNDDQPFPTSKRIPTYERPKPDDPNRATLDAKRRGPFPIGVAVETAPPAQWYDAGETRPKSMRVAAIGEGWFLVGTELSPAKERLVLDTVNWLLGRDDALPRGDHSWSYPRVDLNENDKTLWLLGAGLGLPLLCVYFGTVMWLARRVR
jgi:hypothetical protein